MLVLPLQEDDKVIALVAQHGIKHWTVISKHLKGRTGKQCRERLCFLLVCNDWIAWNESCNHKKR